ncbi:MAG: ACT domain-containing protein [Syntrophomonadaceae bacterium]|jgi:ACT domain-containing protein
MEEGKRLIITVLGHDRVGIIAAIAVILADANVNILDISQTILQGFFTMIMVVDASQSTVDVAGLTDRLQEKGRELGLQISVQHEDVFNFMHRI